MSALAGVQLFLIDMDGTVYLDDTPIPGAADAVNALRRQGRVCFLSNNSSKSKRLYLDKLTRLGFSPAPEEIYTSADATAEYLLRHYAGKSVFVLGTLALREEFSARGIRVTDARPDVVVIGYDTELTYARLSLACIYIREGVPYLATHPDVNCPAAGGYLPDTGSFIKLIEASSGRLPDVICGKPGQVMADAVSARFQVPADKTAMIGDRLSTDIRFAQNAGFKSVLVLSGETDEKMLTDSGLKPDLVLKSIGELRP